MKRPIGPTVPRWKLGDLLVEGRNAVGMTQKQVADHLECSPGKIVNIEDGKSGIVRAEVEKLISLYRITDPEKTAQILTLQKLGKSRGWWTKHGKLPTHFQNFLGIESAAIEIQIYELALVPGLLQTRDYATNHERALAPRADESYVKLHVDLRMDRQEHVMVPEDRPKLWVLLDEGVIRRVTGGHRVMTAQLEHLIQSVEERRCEIQVVPFDAGDHPGTLGKIDIYTFDQDLHTPIVFAESYAGTAWMEEPDDVQRCTEAYSYIRSAALSRAASIKLLKDQITSLKRS